jgi:hypothetical protein
MCVRTTCASCGKATYAGCGAHVEQVLRGVPADQRCKCREQAAEQARDPQSVKR